MDADGGLGGVALMKVLPLQHPGHGVPGRQADEVLSQHGLHPTAVEVDQGLVRVQDFKDLALVGGGVGLNLLLRQGWPGLALAGGVADETGEVADEKDHLVPQVLEVFELLNEHGVTQVQIRGGGVEPGLDPEGSPRGPGLLQPGGKFLFPNDLLAPLPDDGHLFRYWFHEVNSPMR